MRRCSQLFPISTALCDPSDVCYSQNCRCWQIWEGRTDRVFVQCVKTARCNVAKTALSEKNLYIKSNGLIYLMDLFDVNRHIWYRITKVLLEMDQKNDDKKFLSFTLSSSKNASKKINRSANCSTFQKWFKLYRKRDLKNVCLMGRLKTRDLTSRDHQNCGDWHRETGQRETM